MLFFHSYVFYNTQLVNSLFINEDITHLPTNQLSQNIVSLGQLYQMIANTSRYGIFTQCTARFKGQKDAAVVEEFLSVMTAFKDNHAVSDSDALRELPLLFEDHAIPWWIGVKDSVYTFEQAIDLLRIEFTPPKPDWLIFFNIFGSKQQKCEPTDSFICKKRILLSQLAMPLPEISQLDIAYSLLSISIRDRVRREIINSFEDLISASREAELDIVRGIPVITEENREVERRTRCSFCRCRGHTVEGCMKKKQSEPNLNSPIGHDPQSKHIKPTTKTYLFCFGCSAPNVYRSNCLSCNGQSAIAVSPNYLVCNSIMSNVIGHSLPTTNVKFFGIETEAVFDTGAKTSVANLQLKQILFNNSCVFEDVKADIVLADGSFNTSSIMTTVCDIFLGNRLSQIKLIYMPNANNSRILLGTDFLEQAGIVLNMAQRYWCFEDALRQKYSFTSLMETKKSLEQSEDSVPSSSNSLGPPAKVRKVHPEDSSDNYLARLF